MTVCTSCGSRSPGRLIAAAVDSSGRAAADWGALAYKPWMRRCCASARVSVDIGTSWLNETCGPDNGVGRQEWGGATPTTDAKPALVALRHGWGAAAGADGAQGQARPATMTGDAAGLHD